MTEKTQIVELLGEKALVLPALLNNALVANERAKYVLSLLQMAAGQAENPQSPAPTLRNEREACGITDASFDRTVVECECDGHGAYHIPGVQRLVALLDHSLDEMMAPLALVARGPSDSPASSLTMTGRGPLVSITPRYDRPPAHDPAPQQRG